MLFQIVRGWRLGLPRQVVRIAAVVCAYSAALWAGPALLPLLRPLVKVPDFILSALGGAILAMILYSVISTVGALLFKRTGQQSSGIVRLVYGWAGGFSYILLLLTTLFAGLRASFIRSPWQPYLFTAYGAFVGRLRTALNRGREADPIRTVRGVGYALDDLFGRSAA